jgi:hypothetical protein
LRILLQNIVAGNPNTALLTSMMMTISLHPKMKEAVPITTKRIVKAISARIIPVIEIKKRNMSPVQINIKNMNQSQGGVVMKMRVTLLINTRMSTTPTSKMMMSLTDAKTKRIMRGGIKSAKMIILINTMIETVIIAIGGMKTPEGKKENVIRKEMIVKTIGVREETGKRVTMKITAEMVGAEIIDLLSMRNIGHQCAKVQCLSR